MPTVLLITEQKRLRLLFTKLGQEGMFLLRVVPTLAQGAEEIAARLPHFVFVENHISGRPGALSVPYLRALLPQEAEVILLARNDAELDTCRALGGLFSLDLSQSDEALLHSVAQIIQRYAGPRESPPEPVPAAPKSARELLPGGSERQGTSAWFRPLLWIAPLTLVLVVSVILAQRSGKQAPHAAPPKVTSVASVAPAPVSASLPASVPATMPAPVPASRAAGRSSAKTGPGKDAGHRATGKTPVPSGAVSAPTGRNTPYRVRPGDKLLKVLVRDFGYTRLEAERSIPDLKRINKLDSLDLTLPGQVILIPVPQKAGQRPE